MTQVLSILYADDDDDDLDLMREAIVESFPGCTLHLVRTGDAVFDSVKAHSPNIVFLDFNLPKYNGADCLRQLKNDLSLKNIPVVIYSTSSAQASVEECYRLGAARYLLKPVTYDGIFKGLRAIVGLYSTGELITPEAEEFVIDTYKRPHTLR